MPLFALKGADWVSSVLAIQISCSTTRDAPAKLAIWEPLLVSERNLSLLIVSLLGLTLPWSLIGISATLRLLPTLRRTRHDQKRYCFYLFLKLES